MIQRLNIFLLSLIITFAPAYSFAAASGLGAWSIGGISASLGVATINATTEAIINGSSRTIKSFAKVTPSAADLARNIGRFGAVLAVTTAIDALLDGVDWVLDPANNRVIYYEKVLLGDFCYSVSGSCSSAAFQAGTSWQNYNQACQGYYLTLSKSAPDLYTFISCTLKANGDALLTYKYFYNPENTTQTITRIGTGTETTEEKYLPYDAVAARIASDAAAGDPVANDFVKNAVAADIADTTDDGKPLAYPSVPTQLDANQGLEDKADDKDITKTDPNNPDAPTEKFRLPGFCSWAAFICNAMNISNSNSSRAANASEKNVQETSKVTTNTARIATEAQATKDQIKAGNTQAHTDAEKQLAETAKTTAAINDVFKESPQEQDTDFDFPTSSQVTDTRITFSSNCPAPYTLVDSTWLGIPIHWQIDFSKFCTAMTTFVRPIVIAMASFQAVRIVSGQNDNG